MEKLRFWVLGYLSFFFFVLFLIFVFDWLLHRLYSNIMWLDKTSDQSFIRCNPKYCRVDSLWAGSCCSYGLSVSWCGKGKKIFLVIAQSNLVTSMDMHDISIVVYFRIPWVAESMLIELLSNNLKLHSSSIFTQQKISRRC